MSRVSAEFANATAVASGFISIHLFEMLIEKGVLGVEEGMAVLKKARGDLEQAIGVRHLDPTLFEAEQVISSLYASLHNRSPSADSTAAARPEDRAPAKAA
jgi:hypothetical protein